ncbi:MAG: nitroreductase family protein [Euzebya sp.]
MTQALPDPVLVPLEFKRIPPEQMRRRAGDLQRDMQRRRTVRDFSTEAVDPELITAAVDIASSAPSGAHRQPWTFVVVTDPDVRQQIRTHAEAEEAEFYAERAPDEWLRALAPLGTDSVKRHLTDAPYLVVLFKHRYTVTADGGRSKNYYASESCGIAAGFFIAAVHQMGLVTLTHTPSPMAFLSQILQRPPHEQPYLVLPVGYPAVDATVPDIARKPLAQVLVWH